MRTRLRQALALFAVATASATVSRPALSADLSLAPPPVYDAAEPLPPQDVFEGWWLGGTVGGATVNYDFAPAGTVDTDGVVGGVIGGWSWQNGPLVVGIEGDFMGADIDGGRRFSAGLNQVSPSIDAMADLRLRAGVTVTPQILLFGTFGGAWANADLPISGPGGGSGSADFFGWSVGGGAEVALSPNWSARLDYQFTDFDKETINYSGGRQTFDPDANTYRGSLIYRF